jgi:copper chaperone
MSCGHCVRAVRAALASVEGVEVLDVQVGSARVRVPDEAHADAAAAAVTEAGYDAVPGDAPATPLTALGRRRA